MTVDRGNGKSKRSRNRTKGVFCLEGNWWGNLDRPSTIRPILELLHQAGQGGVPFVHHRFETRSELDHCLKVWLQVRYRRFPILYLACHGNPGEICFGDGRRRENVISLPDLGQAWDGRCKGRIIHFGSCSTVNVHGNQLNAFLRRIGALAVCGYRNEVDWLEAAAFECLLFSAMQANALTRSGVVAMRSRINHLAGPLAKKLAFRMVCRGSS